MKIIIGIASKERLAVVCLAGPLLAHGIPKELLLEQMNIKGVKYLVLNLKKHAVKILSRNEYQLYLVVKQYGAITNTVSKSN